MAVTIAHPSPSHLSLTSQPNVGHPQRPWVNPTGATPITVKLRLIVELGCDLHYLASWCKGAVCFKASRKASFTLTKRYEETVSCCCRWRLSRCDVRTCGSHLVTMKRPSWHAKNDQEEHGSLTRSPNYSAHWPENHPILSPKTTCLSCFDLQVPLPIAENRSTVTELDSWKNVRENSSFFITCALQRASRNGLLCLTPNGKVWKEQVLRVLAWTAWTLTTKDGTCTPQ